MLNISTKLALSYIFFSVAVSISISLFLLFTISNYQESLEWNSLNEYLEKTSSAISKKQSELEEITNFLYYNNDIQEFIYRSRTESPSTTQLSTINNFLETLKIQSSMKDTTLYAMNINNSDYYHLKDLNELREYTYFKEINETLNQFIWISPNSASSISLFHPLRYETAELLGVIELKLSSSSILEKIERIGIIENSVVILSTRQGNIIGHIGDDSGIFLSRYIGESQNWHYVSIADQKWAVSAFNIPNTKLVTTLLIPQSAIRHQRLQIIKYISFSIIILSFVSVFIARIVSKSATTRLIALKEKMNNLRLNNKSEYYLEDSNKDEIGQLIQSYNFMLNRIDELVSEKYKIQLYLKNEELKTLQAQINPHFLYNTLDLINWKSIKTGNEDIADISRTLAQYYYLCR